jgi:hypothetical protein
MRRVFFWLCGISTWMTSSTVIWSMISCSPSSMGLQQARCEHRWQLLHGFSNPMLSSLCEYTCPCAVCLPPFLAPP